MTAEVEQRIVEMRFDNEQFEKGAKQTLSTLEKLDGILDMLGSGGGMDHLSSALDAMEYRFSRLGIAGAAAIERITGKVITLASNVLTAIPQQIMAGGEARAMNIEQARFQLKGLGVAWDELSDSIDYAVMGTAYGVDEAAKIASILVASKVDFKNAADGATDLGHALRGISGIAGMTNSSFEEIGNLMGDIFAMGKLSTRQLQSFELRGLNVAAKLAELSQNGQLKHLGDDAKYTEEQIRDLVSKGKIDALTFAKAMDAAFGEHATKANETYTGALRNLKASLSRIGEPFFTAWHEGLRKIFLEARQTFDRVKAIVKPFAEGKFTKVIDTLSDKVVRFLNDFDLRWLERIVDFFDKSDAWVKPVDFLIDRLNDLNEISKRLFSSGGGRSGIGDKYEWVFDIKKSFESLLSTVKKAGNIFSKFFRSLHGSTYLRYLILAISDLVKDAMPYANRALDWFDAHSDNISKFVQNVITAGLNTIVIFKQVVGALVRFGGSVINLFGTILNRLFSGNRAESIFDAYRDGAWKLSDSLTTGIDKLTAFVNKITELIDKGPSAESSLGKIGHGFEVVGGFVGGIINGISTFLSYLFGLKEGETLFSKFGDTLKAVGEIIRTAVGYIRTGIQTFFGGEDGKQFIKNAAALYTVLMGYRKIESTKWAFSRFGRAFEFIKELITGTYEKIKAINPLEWADTIETLLKRTSGALRAFSDNLNAKSLLTIGGAVVVLALGLAVLAAVAEGDNIGEALRSLAAVMTLLVVAFWAIKKVTDQGLFKDIAKGWKGLVDVFKNSISKYFNAVALKETATAMLFFSLAVGVLAIAVAGLAFVFSKVKLEDILLAVATVGALTVLLTGMLVWITKATAKLGALDSTKFLAFAAAFIGIAVAVGILSLAIAGLAWAFSKIDGDKFWTVVLSAIGAVVALCVVLAGAAIALSRWAQDPMVLFAATAMVLLAAAIDILVLGLIGLAWAITQLGGKDGKGGGGKLWNAFGMIAALAVILGALTWAIGNFAPLALLGAPAAVLLAVAIDLLIVGVIGLGYAIKKMGSKNLWNAIGMILALSVIFVGLMTIVGALSPILAAAGSVFKTFSSVAKNLAEAFKDIADGMVVLATALNMMPADGSLEVIGKGLGKVAGGLTKLGFAAQFMPRNPEEIFNSLIPLGTAMLALEDVDIPKLVDKKTGLPALSDALRKAFGGKFFGLFGSLGTSMGVGSAGLAAAGPALALLGTGLQALAPGLEAFNNAGDLDSITEHLQALVYAVMDISDYGYDTTFKFMPQMAESLSGIAESLNGLSAEQIALVSSLGTALSEAFTDNTGAATTALLTELEQLTTTLNTGSQQFIINARRIPTHIQSGIEDNTSLAINAMKKMLWDMGKEANSDQQRENWRIIGGNIAIGIANGIASRTAEAANSMRRLATALQKSFTVSLAIRSPSRVFESLAEYIPMGIARGIQNGENGITDSMASSMSGAMNLLDQYSRGTDFAPTVTPVMDMANMRRDMRYANHMFQGTSLGQFGGVSGLHVSGDAISYNMQNKDVVTEIKHLGTKVSQLGEAFEKMQMILDTGALVGQIAPGINRELGVIAIRERRQ